jgi:hypothetical protein
MRRAGSSGSLEQIASARRAASMHDSNPGALSLADCAGAVKPARHSAKLASRIHIRDVRFAWLKLIDQASPELPENVPGRERLPKD